jgi:hypothetical protein
MISWSLGVKENKKCSTSLNVVSRPSHETTNTAVVLAHCECGLQKNQGGQLTNWPNRHTNTQALASRRSIWTSTSVFVSNFACCSGEIAWPAATTRSSSSICRSFFFKLRTACAVSESLCRRGGESSRVLFGRGLSRV